MKCGTGMGEHKIKCRKMKEKGRVLALERPVSISNIHIL
jgi:hypothetical protein